MRTRDKLALAALAGAGAVWGTKAFLRHHRWMDLKDRVVVVTGADGGFGLILCRHLAEHGAIVVMAARKAEALDEAAVEVRRAGAADVLTVPTDVTDEAQARALIDAAIGRYGRVDVLVNNAGLMLVGAEPTVTLDDFRKLMETNFWGAFHTSRAALPHMREARSGRIANVSSIGGRAVVPHMLPYIASKFALTGYTKGLRVEASRDNVFVTGIYPATIRTGGHAHAWIKGDKRAEYAWFALADSVPGLSISADKAAAMAIRGIQAGEPEVVIGLSARLALAFDGVFPDLSSEIISLIERAMPAPQVDGEPAVQGKDVRGRIADFANRLIPDRARP